MPAGPEPITGTFLQVSAAAISALTQPFSQARSTIAHSMVLMVTGLSSMLSVHEASHGAGQMRPVNSGELVVESRLRDASSQLPPYTRSLKSGICLLTGQPGVPGATEPVPWQ